MNSKILSVISIVFLACLAIGEGMSLKGLGVDSRCHCIKTESRRIAKQIEKVEIFSPSSHCKDTEIIATVKENGILKPVCLDPKTPWVKKLVEKMLASKAT